MNIRTTASLFTLIALVATSAPFVADAAVEVYKTQSKRDFLTKVYADQRAYGNAGDNTAAHGRNVPSTQRSDTGMRICYLYDPTAYITQWSLGGFDSPGNNRMAAWNPSLNKWEVNSANYYHNSRYNYVTCMSDAPPDSSLNASKLSIARGESVTLTWKSQYGEIRKGSCTAQNFSFSSSGGGGTGGGSYLQCGPGSAGWNPFTGLFGGGGSAGFGSCYVSGGAGNAGGSSQFGGSVNVSPQQTTTYTCNNANGSTSESVTVEVASTLRGSCTVAPGSARPGETVTWTASATGGVPTTQTVTTGGGVCSPQSINYYNPTCNPRQELSDFTCPDGYRAQIEEVLCWRPAAYQSRPFSDRATCVPCEVGSSGQTTTTGAPAYTYFWSGSGNLAGDTESVEKTYAEAGVKTATVTIMSGGESIQIDCENSVNISGEPVQPTGEQPRNPNTPDPNNPVITIPQTPVTGPPSVRLTADDTELKEGESTRLRWETENVISCATENFVLGGLLENVLAGLRITPARTTDYTIDCMNSLNQHAYDSVEVTVITAPALDLRAAPDRLRPQEKTRISWNGESSNFCSILGPGLYETGVQGNAEITIHNESTFTLNCSKAGYAYQKSITVRLLPGYGEE